MVPGACYNFRGVGSVWVTRFPRQQGTTTRNKELYVQVFGTLSPPSIVFVYALVPVQIHITGSVEASLPQYLQHPSSSLRSAVSFYFVLSFFNVGVAAQFPAGISFALGLCAGSVLL